MYRKSSAEIQTALDRAINHNPFLALAAELGVVPLEEEPALKAEVPHFQRLDSLLKVGQSRPHLFH